MESDKRARSQRISPLVGYNRRGSILYSRPYIILVLYVTEKIIPSIPVEYIVNVCDGEVSVGDDLLAVSIPDSKLGLVILIS